MFPNLSGSPMDLGNLLNRAILPALNRCVSKKQLRNKMRKLIGRRRAIARRIKEIEDALAELGQSRRPQSDSL